MKLADETGISPALPYFSNEIDLLVTAKNDGSLCRVMIEQKNKNFRIKSITPYEPK